MWLGFWFNRACVENVTGFAKARYRRCNLYFPGRKPARLYIRLLRLLLDRSRLGDFNLLRWSCFFGETHSLCTIQTAVASTGFVRVFDLQALVGLAFFFMVYPTRLHGIRCWTQLDTFLDLCSGIGRVFQLFPSPPAHGNDVGFHYSGILSCFFFIVSHSSAHANDVGFAGLLPGSNFCAR